MSKVKHTLLYERLDPIAVSLGETFYFSYIEIHCKVDDEGNQLYAPPEIEGGESQPIILFKKKEFVHDKTKEEIQAERQKQLDIAIVLNDGGSHDGIIAGLEECLEQLEDL